jgi:hypothetical protein
MPDYQVVIDFITHYFYIVAPIAIIFTIVEIVTNFFLSFIRGDRRVKL